MPRTPLYRGQGNEPFRTSEPVSAAKRGQTVPYGENGAPPETTVNNDNWSGADLAIENGGTGASSQQAMRDNFSLYTRGESDARYAPRSAALVKPSVAVTAINLSTEPVLPWNSEVYDDAGWHDNVTNNSRFTVPEGVTRVAVGAMVRFTNNTPGLQTLFIRKNGTTFAAHMASTGAASHLSLQVRDACVAGDYYEVAYSGPDTSADLDPLSQFWIEAT